MFFEVLEDGLILYVKVTPKASANKFLGLENAPNNKKVLKLMVTTVPEDGKANAAVIKLLAKTLKVSKSSLDIIQGQTSKIKTIKITGNADELKTRLLALVS